MSIEIRQLRCAVLTADTQSFSHSAQAMNIKQSTLGRRVATLEQRLGIRLDTSKNRFILRGYCFCVV